MYYTTLPMWEEMLKKKKIKCQICDEMLNKTEVIVKTITTDNYLGMNWGIPYWEEYQVRSCPHCGYSLDLKLDKETIKKLRENIK